MCKQISYTIDMTFTFSAKPVEDILMICLSFAMCKCEDAVIINAAIVMM